MTGGEMDYGLPLSFILFSALTLLNLLLTMALIHQVNRISAMIYRQPELPIGVLAPDFEAQTLTGDNVSLATYAGRSVLFLFVHPHCQACTSKVPVLERLAPLACRVDSIHFVLVIEDKYTLARSMVDKMGVSLPVLIAPRQKSEFVKDYNPEGIYPYYCLLDENGVVRSRAPLGHGDWPEMQRKWETISQPKKILAERYM